MATLTTAWANHIYNLVNLGTAPPTLTGVYLRLFTADPTDAGSFTNEVTGGSYLGQDITSAMTGPTNGAGTSDSNISFADMPATTVSHWAKCKSAASTGADEMIERDAFAAPIVVDAGQTLLVPVGDLNSTAA